MTSPSARIVFAGGGTGGHLYPAIAIADRVSQLIGKDRPVEIIFVGTRRGIEYRLRDNLGYPLKIINIRGLVRSFTLKNLLVPFLVIAALMKSHSLLKQFRPDVVVGTGGYVSWPVLRAAAFMNIPIVLQEQNSFPGITTRKLAPFARRIFLGFGAASRYLRTSTKIVVSGNPVRTTVASGDRETAIAEFGLDKDKKTILILGGSQGAHTINQAVLGSLKSAGMPDGVQLLWQTGKRDYKDVAASAGDKVSGHSLFPFVEKIQDCYAAADLVVARAGALTLAELEACGLPAVLIPYPFAAGDHQKKNAREVVETGAAELLPEEKLADIDLLAQVSSLLLSDRFEKMKAAAKARSTRAKPAVDIIAEAVIQLANDSREERGSD